MAVQLLIILFSIFSSSLAAPIPRFRLPKRIDELNSLSKRPQSHIIAIGFAIAISIIIFSVIIFYLGVRRGLTGTWCCWRSSVSLPMTPIDHYFDHSMPKCVKNPKHPEHPDLHYSHHAIEPDIKDSLEISPVEKSPSFLELPADNNVPRLEGDRKTWRKSEKRSLYEMEGSCVQHQQYLTPSLDDEKRKLSEESKEESMDRSGIEYIRNFFGRKSDVGRARE
ncbi:hypothetical protein CC78DRAFT_530864 [Lojkania enalia]|uniref:Uncharacterized protein n=1 Tax=Lojkania enalia TaxID=147567 RepID=A0A9P4N7V9_9PLEO|nr:hypothetical protein CC78DRAFT_530864 [Didymosphaeria enalia]